MSGHSKWHNIQAKKGKTDAARARVFTKIGKELMVAAKENPNPETNSKLKDVVSKAKSANMPMDNIMRAIKKAAGELGSANFEEITYEGYGPGGTAFIVEALTDNKNRTAATVRHAFDKTGGNLGTTGSVTFMFTRLGQIIIEKTDEINEEELMMEALEAGASDFETEEDTYIVTTSPETFSSVRDALEGKGYTFLENSVGMVPNILTKAEGDIAAGVLKLIDILEEDDDVSEIYHNADIIEE